MKTEKMTAEEKIKKAIHVMAVNPELIAYIKEVEAKSETTKGHYREYMRFISGFPSGMRKIIATALMQAGADIEGIQGVMMVLSI